MIRASYGHYGQRAARIGPDSIIIVYAGSDFPHPFQFRFYKEGMGHAVQNRPGSDLDGLAMVWLNSSALKQAGVQYSSGPVSGRTQPARYQFPNFRLGSVLTQIILYKTSPDLI